LFIKSNIISSIMVQVIEITMSRKYFATTFYTSKVFEHFVYLSWIQAQGNATWKGFKWFHG
jgi:hypothetical protein